MSFSRLLVSGIKTVNTTLCWIYRSKIEAIVSLFTGFVIARAQIRKDDPKGENRAYVFFCLFVFYYSNYR